MLSPLFPSLPRLARRWRAALWLGLCLSLLLGGCGQQTPPPPPASPTPIPSIVIPNPPCDLKPGQRIPLSVLGITEPGATYNWSASAGLVNPMSGPTVTYTAPPNGGQVTIRVDATLSSGITTAMMFCNVIDDSPEITNTSPPEVTDPPPTDTPAAPVEPAPPDTPAPAPCCLTGWNPYTDDRGSQLDLQMVNDALVMDYWIMPNGGFVVATLEISPVALQDSTGVRFLYDSTDSGNLLEIKLLYRPGTGPDGENQTFAYSPPQASGTGTLVQALYPDFLCWTTSGCLLSDIVQTRLVWKFEIAVKNISDQIHEGEMTVYDIEFTR